MQQKVNGAEAHEYPIMRAIFENIEEGHGVIGEAVNEESLELTLDVVSEYHGEAEFLVECVRLAFAINLL